MQNNVFYGKWICPEVFSDLKPLNMYHKERETPSFCGEHNDELRNYHAFVRREFELKKESSCYLLKFSADDYAKVYINGKFVGQGPTTGYIEEYNYCEIDVTDYLIDGKNEITAHLYYQGLINRVWISGDNRMGFIADLVDANGQVLICTNSAWEYTKIPNYTSMRTTGYETQYLEDYDSRLTCELYAPVSVRKNNDIIFKSTPTPMLQIYSRSPIVCERLSGGGIFYDFGSEITATLQITATGQSGDTIDIFCGEELDDSSPFKVRYQMRCNCEYKETWTLADGENTLDQFDYKAFRYVALIPSSESVCVKKIVAVVRHAQFDDNACVLKAEDKVLQSVFDICKNGVKFGTQEVYVDCPTREKGQYAGDMTVTSTSQLWLTGNPFMLEKGIRDQAASSKIDAGLMSVISGAYMQEIADYSLQFPLLLLQHYKFTGDKDFLRSMLPIAENMFAHFKKYEREDGLIEGVTDKWNLVDWPDNLRDGYDFPMTNPIGLGVHNVMNAFYIGCILNIEEIKDILGIPHNNESKTLIDSFYRAFFRKDIGLFVDAENSNHSSAHSNMLAAFYGFVPTGYEENIAEFLVKKGLVCGVYMSYFLLRALCKLGRYEDVYKMITSTSQNSWYNMVREGGTTCFEAWGKDQKWNTSLCHPWASGPIAVLIEDLLNVSPDGTVGEPRIPKWAGKIEMTIPTQKGNVHIKVN